MRRLKVLSDLFYMFFIIGLFTFGGGYAMLPLFQREIVKKRGYATDDEILDLYSIGQCTPGIIAVNIATFIGYKISGIAGGIVATVGIVSPSVMIITLIATSLKNFMSYVWVEHAFAGIRLCVVAMLVNILYGLFRKNIKKKYDFFILVLASVLLFGLHWSSIAIILLVVMVTLSVHVLKKRKEGEK